MSKVLGISVGVDTPPKFNQTPLQFGEGDSLTVLKSTLVSDPEGDAFTASFHSSDAHLILREVGSSLVLKGSDSDVYGVFSLVMILEFRMRVEAQLQTELL